MAQVFPDHMARVSILISVILDSTLYQVPIRIMRGLAQTTGQDSRPRVHPPEALQEDTRERDILWQDTPERDHRLLVVEEDFRIAHPDRTDTVTAE